jgi:transcriptional regulator with XRE-family HTH domain
MNRTDELRSLISLLGISQREAAERLEVTPRLMRYWAASNPPPPLMAIYALQHLLTLDRNDV